jgi:two-component system, LytTR family, response regulator
MTELRVVVADDEPMALRVLAEAVVAEPDLRLVARCGNGREALDAILEHRPDLAFLDIRMPELDGFEIVDALRPEDRPRVIFVTAHDEHALEAFRRHALAYLLKPFEDEDFRRAIAHVRTLVRPDVDERRLRDLIAEMMRQRSAPRHIVARSGKRTRLVPVESIDWIEAEGNYARLHCGTEDHLVSETLGSLVERLAAGGFARVHRSAAVNLERVREFRTDDHRDYTVVLRGGEQLRLSRTFREEVERRLGDRI